jgi:copper resistance protein C
MRIFAIFIALSLLLGLPAAAEAHAFLASAEPPVGSTVARAPSVITLHFTEELEPKFSGAEVTDAAGKRVDRGSSASGTVMRIRLKSLPPGGYHVSWHALSVDTHKTQGSFSFTVGR